METITFDQLPELTEVQLTDEVLLSMGSSVRKTAVSNLIGVENIARLLKIFSTSTGWGLCFDYNYKGTSTGGVTFQKRLGNSSAWDAYLRKCGRYLLKYQDGDMNLYKINRTDPTLLYDGTPLDETQGNVMVYMPTLYYEVILLPHESSNNTRHAFLWMDTVEFDGAKKLDQMVLGAYLGSVANNTLFSRSGKSPLTNLTISQGMGRAKQQRISTTDVDWNQYFGLMHYEHIQRLAMMLMYNYRTSNSQGAIGFGLCGQGETDDRTMWDAAKGLLTGETLTLGDSCGAITDSSQNQHINLWGLENLWGWMHTSIIGAYMGSADNPSQSARDIFVYSGNRLPSTEELATHPSTPYRKLLAPLKEFGVIGGMHFGENFDVFPRTVNSNDAYVNWGFYDWLSRKITNQGLWMGGYAAWGKKCGLYTLTAESWSYKYSMYGHRLAYYGPVNIHDEE